MDLQNLSDNQLLNEIARRFEGGKSGDTEKLLIQLNEVNKKLKESESVKSHFISNITNEIVNPFSSILGLSRNIMQVKDDGLEQAKKMASLIYSEAFNLDFQLKNIFAAARIEAGQFMPEYTRVDINALIQSVLKDYQFKADAKQIEIEFSSSITTNEENPVFITDAEKLRLIMSNLLSNSIKYSNITDKVELNANISMDLLKINIRDYGVGIDESSINNIFDRFSRGFQNINSLNQGHGLGLSIVKACLDFINGKIEVKSKKGSGTEFFLEIPTPVDKEQWDTFSTDSNEQFFEDGELF